MRSYARGVDGETGAAQARVPEAHTYDLRVALYERRVGAGVIRCHLVRSSEGPARRLVQLVADYYEAGVAVTTCVQVASDDEELRELARLERVMLAAQRRPALV